MNPRAGAASSAKGIQRRVRVNDGDRDPNQRRGVSSGDVDVDATEVRVAGHAADGERFAAWMIWRGGRSNWATYYMLGTMFTLCSRMVVVVEPLALASLFAHCCRLRIGAAHIPFDTSGPMM